MPTKPKFRFSIATLLWLMVCVAVFFGGRMSREPEINEVKRIEKFRRQMQVHEQDNEIADLMIEIRDLEYTIGSTAKDNAK